MRKTIIFILLTVLLVPLLLALDNPYSINQGLAITGNESCNNVLNWTGRTASNATSPSVNGGKCIINTNDQAARYANKLINPVTNPINYTAALFFGGIQNCDENDRWIRLIDADHPATASMGVMETSGLIYLRNEQTGTKTALSGVLDDGTNHSWQIVIDADSTQVIINGTLKADIAMDTGFEPINNFSFGNTALSTSSCTGNWDNWVSFNGSIYNISAIPPDIILPVVNITNINASDILRINDLWNTSSFITDDTLLSFANITYNLTGLGSGLYNFSFLGLTGTTAVISQNITINLTRGNVINATVIATDAAGNIAQNSTKITIADTIGIVTIGLNSTSLSINQVVNVSSNLTDADGLSFCLIKTNQTGVFVNNTFELSGTSGFCSDPITITVTKGTVVNFTVELNDTLGGIIYENSAIITTINSVPSAPTIILPTPDDYNNTQPNYPFNITYPVDLDGDTITTVIYYINGKKNQTISPVTNTTFNASDGYYILNVSLFDGEGWGANATVNFTIDTTLPTLLTFNTTNNTIFGFNVNVTLNITIQDTNPFNLSYTWFNESDSKIYFAFNDQKNSTTTITIIETLNLTQLASGNYTLNISFSDRHTNAKIEDYGISNNPNGFTFYTAEGSEITILQTVGNSNQNELKTTRKIDRYTIEFGTSAQRQQRKYMIVADKDIKIIEDSRYKGHLIIGKNWMDFENGDRESTVTVQRLGNNMVMVTVYSNNFNFNSIGGLNVVDVFYNFQVDNHPPTFPDQSLNNTFPDVGEIVEAAFTCSDLIAISTCFIATNATGSWKNVTNVTVPNGITNFFNLTHNLTIASDRQGHIIGFQAFANDTFNEFSSSSIQTLSVNDTETPEINGTFNNTLFQVNQSINVTFNMSDNFLLDTCQIIITDGGIVRFFNFTLSGTSDTCSQNFTVSGPPKNVINVTGRVNDTLGNFQTNTTIFSVTKDFIVRAINTLDNTSILQFNVSLSNSTFSLNISTTNGTVTFNNIIDGTFNIDITSNATGGYHNKSFVNYDTTNHLVASMHQAVVFFTAIRRGTNVTVIDFNVSVPLASNQSNSSGGTRLLLNATNYEVSGVSDDYFDVIAILNLTNKSTTRKVVEFYDINLSIFVNSEINNTVLKNFTIFLNGNNSDFTENLTAISSSNVTFSLGNNTYDIIIDAPQHSLFFARFFIGSNDTFPNLTFSLTGLNSINFSIFDEITEELILGNDTTIDLISDSLAINDSPVDNGRLYIQDLIPGEYRITYDHPVYTKRDFYVNIINGTNQSVDLYLLSIGNGTDVTFTVQDNSGNKLNNATIRLKRYYLSTNSYRTVAMSRTNEEGNTQIDVDFNDAFYETLTTFKAFSLRTIGAKIISTTRILTLQLTADPFELIDGTDDLTTSLTFNNNTQTFSYVFTQLGGLNTKGTLDVIFITPTSSSLVCTSTDTTSSGTLICQVNTTNATGTYTAKGYVTVGNKNVLTNTVNIITGITAQLRDIVGEQGFFFAILISGTLAGLGALVSPAVAMVMFLVGIFISNFLGFSVIAASGLGLLIIITMVVIWRMRK